MLRAATRISGLGTAGASGLLAVIWPQFFGTVDQFVVKSLRRVETDIHTELLEMDSENLEGLDGVILTHLFRKKAGQLTSDLGGPWTPRMLDMVLWAFRYH